MTSCSVSTSQPVVIVTGKHIETMAKLSVDLAKATKIVGKPADEKPTAKAKPNLIQLPPVKKSEVV